MVLRKVKYCQPENELLYGHYDI